MQEGLFDKIEAERAKIEAERAKEQRAEYELVHGWNKERAKEYNLGHPWADVEAYPTLEQMLREPVDPSDFRLPYGWPNAHTPTAIKKRAKLYGELLAHRATAYRDYQYAQQAKAESLPDSYDEGWTYQGDKGRQHRSLLASRYCQLLHYRRECASVLAAYPELREIPESGKENRS